MLRIYLIAIIATLAGLIVLALLVRLGRRHAEGSVLIAWRHVISAAAGLVVFFGAALMLEVGGTSQPGTDYQPPRIEDGKIKPGEFKKSELNIDNWPTVPFIVQQTIVHST
tara:strand:+ start:351 stop:683 length:333 start_codon:yes stop_codon:yes gene_type:complete